MKKNLKKIISAVIALSLSGSIIPVSFAAKTTFSDIEKTATYKNAVDTLVSLGIINGYEDGTFLPDSLITRAEVTKIIVAALNMLDDAEKISNSTQFTDMEEKSAWANGFVNVGVQMGFINGMGDGTFAPEANVTYEQIVKMLVSSLGYDEYAGFLGGYPAGYLSVGNSEGLTEGVKSEINNNVTRAQVAQLVYNFLFIPIIETTGIDFSSNAPAVTYVKMDGANKTAYKTILTEKFNAYHVEGYVTEIHNSDKGQISFGIAKSQNYDNDKFSYTTTVDFDELKNSTRVLSPVFVGDINAVDYQGIYSSAIIQTDEEGNYVLISLEAKEK